MSLINQADSLMAIFGFHRVQCCHCHHSICTDKQDMLCSLKNELVKRDSQCAEYMRDGGSDE